MPLNIGEEFVSQHQRDPGFYYLSSINPDKTTARSAERDQDEELRAKRECVQSDGLRIP